MRLVVSTPKLKSRTLRGLFVASLIMGMPAASHGQSAEEDLRLETDVGDETLPPAPIVPAISRISIEDDAVPPPRRRRVVEDPYAPTGIDLGAFQLFPTLEIGSVTTSNVARNSTPESDVGLRLKPGLKLESDWVRHQLRFSAAADVLRYLDNNDLATTNGSVDSALRLDIRRDTRADLAASYSLTSTGAENSEVPDTAIGARVDHTLAASAALTHNWGALEGTAKLGLTRNLFGDVALVGGGSEDNSDRAYTEVSASLRGSLKTGALLQPFAEVAYEPRLHDKKSDRNGLKRNSQGLRLSAGLSFADDPIWTGDIAATLQLRKYADDSLDSMLAPGITANLNWQPTDLTRFEFNSGLSLAETVSAGSSATRSWNGGISMVHALRENIDFTAGIAVTLDNTNAGNSLSTTGRLGVAWDINPTLTWTAGYQGTWVNGLTSAGDYNEQQVLTSIILKR